MASYQDFLASCRKLSPYPIEFENIASPNVRGYCSFEEQRIVVRSGLSQVQTAKTVLHEITHAILHNEGDAKTRAEKELEAESAAFVICSHYGIDTSSIPFLTWPPGVVRNGTSWNAALMQSKSTPFP